MMAAGTEHDSVLGRGDNSSYLNIAQGTLLADDPHAVLYDRTHRRYGSISITLGVMVVLALAGGIGLYIYSRLLSSAPTSTEIPILQAVPEVIKVRPDNPGGLDVPNRDKLIYQQMDEVVVTSSGEEHLLPPVEVPIEPPLEALEGESVGGRGKLVPPSVQPAEATHRLDRDFTMPMVTIDSPKKSSPERLPDMLAVTPTVVVPVPTPAVIVEPSVTVAPPATAIRPERPVSSLSELIARQVEPSTVHKTLEGKGAIAPRITRLTAPTAVPLSTSKAAVVAQKSAVPGEGTRLQLGSFKSTADANKAWSRLANRHGDLLGSTLHTVVQVDLRAKGVWYRVYAGPYSNVRVALSICDALKQRSVGCIFAHK